MPRQINRIVLLDKIHSAHSRWDRAIKKLDPALMLKPGMCGPWSAKDIVAHLTWHECEMVNLIRAHALVGSDLWDLPTERRNHAIYIQNKNRSLADVLDQAGRVFELLIPAVESLSEEDLQDPGRFPGMPLDWRPWKLIAENTYEHYQDHLPQIQAWQPKAGSRKSSPRQRRKNG